MGMRWGPLGFCLALTFAGTQAKVTFVEMQTVPKNPAVREVAFFVASPESLGGSTVQTLMRSPGLGAGPSATPEESMYMESLRAFGKGDAISAARTWDALRYKRISAELAACLRVNQGVLEFLRHRDEEAQIIEVTIRHVWAQSGRHGVDALMGRAVESLHTGDYEQALESLDRVVAVAPDFGEARRRFDAADGADRR